MLATSTVVLVKAIPDTPDADYILERHQRRARQDSAAMLRYSESASLGPSTAYQSEAEIYGDASPENSVVETPSDNGVAGRDWGVDHAWFNTLSDADGGIGSHGDTNMPNAYLELNNTQEGFGFE